MSTEPMRGEREHGLPSLEEIADMVAAKPEPAVFRNAKLLIQGEATNKDRARRKTKAKIAAASKRRNRK